MKDELKFCVDCKHCDGNNFGHDCLNEKCVGEPNLVTGKTRALTCDDAREPSGPCGKEAMHFSPKEEE